MGAYTTTVIQMVITGGGQYLIEDKLLGTTLERMVRYALIAR